MKSTGIIRRIDDLRRITIPKEICTRLNLTDGTPIEFYEDNQSLILKKYSPSESYIDILSNWHDDIKNDEDISESRKMKISCLTEMLIDVLRNTTSEK